MTYGTDLITVENEIPWSKQSLKYYLKNMTNGTKIITGIISKKPFNTPFHDDMLQLLLTFHPMYDQKKLNNLSHLEVRKSPPFFKNTLFFLTTDNVCDDVSYKMCIKNLFDKFDNSTLIRDDTLKAFRNAIFNDSRLRSSFYKNIGSSPICQHCNTFCDEFHIDHYCKPFSQLLDEFLLLENITLHDVKVIQPSSQFLKIKDCKLQSKWVSYHDKHATLRLLCKSCNLSLGAYGYTSLGETFSH